MVVRHFRQAQRERVKGVGQGLQRIRSPTCGDEHGLNSSLVMPVCCAPMTLHVRLEDARELGGGRRLPRPQQSTASTFCRRGWRRPAARSSARYLRQHASSSAPQRPCGLASSLNRKAHLVPAPAARPRAWVAIERRGAGDRGQWGRQVACAPGSGACGIGRSSRDRHCQKMKPAKHHQIRMSKFEWIGPGRAPAEAAAGGCWRRAASRQRPRLQA